MRHKFEQVLKGKKTHLKHRHTRPGGRILEDHYISAVTGQLLHIHGRERQENQAGTLIVDHASGKLFNIHQFSTGAVEIVKIKHTLEHFSRDKGFKIKSYQSDNEIFSSTKFTSDCDRPDQKLNYSGVGAQHHASIQN